MATNNSQKQILVYADWKEMRGAKLMGTLTATSIKGREVFAFEYTKAWLESKFSQRIDPDLEFYSGQQFLKEGKRNFGIFLDSSPDRWGETLMKRREEIMARKEGRRAKTLLASDFLLGVYDQHRMGALRFKEAEKAPFLNDDKAMAAPPWASLRELEIASKKYEEDSVDDKESLKWINLLIVPGSSLGGARPKASVVDTQGHLWIAKFPSRKDDYDVGCWEMVANELAINAGLNVAQGMVHKYNREYHTFHTKRFDRTKKGERIHFASAMTLLGLLDGTGHEDGVSYLQLAGFLMKQGADTQRDLEELWRRVVFNICIKNTDDHLRNHGFLLTESGWLLSPAYDINPVSNGIGLSLNISENDNSLNLELALEVAEYFNLKKDKAHEIIKKIRKAVDGWRTVAKKYRIPKLEQDRMQNAFII